MMLNTMRYLLSILLLVFSSAVQCEDMLPKREAVPRLAVFPLLSEKDLDYGFLWLTVWWMN